jgi:hypothetical protein
VGIGIRLTLAPGALASAVERRLSPLTGPLAAPPDVELSLEPEGAVGGAGPELRLQTREDGWLVDRSSWAMEICLGTPVRARMCFKGELRGVGPETLALHLTVGLQVLLYLVAPHFDCLFMHAAGVRTDGGHAVVLVGGPDAGKTTACRNAPLGAAVLSDEHVLCGPGEDGRWAAHATPFASDTRSWRHPPGYLPLSALFLLERGPEAVTPAPPAHALRILMRSAAKLGSPTGARALDLCGELAAAVPVWRLVSDQPQQVWPAIRRALASPG